MKGIISVFIASSILSAAAYAGQWQQDETGRRYQNDDGSYKTGWFQDLDGQWYYFSDESSYLLTVTITPDGYLVSDTGYDNKADLQVTAYDNMTQSKDLGYTLPVSVYYNSGYKNIVAGELAGMQAVLADDGVPYLKFVNKSEYGFYKLDVIYRCFYGDGDYYDVADTLAGAAKYNEDISRSLLKGRFKTGDNGENPVSLEIYINASAE